MNKHAFDLGNTYLFGYNYNGGEPTDVIAEKPTSIDENKILFNFLYGHHSLSEYVPKEDIIAVGDIVNGTTSIMGWSGKFLILNQEKFEELLKTKALQLKE